jgi:hypothetical protein
MADFDDRLNVSWWALRVGLGVGPIITGIDKYFNKLADWSMYLSPLAAKVVPVGAATLMHAGWTCGNCCGADRAESVDQDRELCGYVLAARHCGELGHNRHVLRPCHA